MFLLFKNIFFCFGWRNKRFKNRVMDKIYFFIFESKKAEVIQEKFIKLFTVGKACSLIMNAWNGRFFVQIFEIFSKKIFIRLRKKEFFIYSLFVVNKSNIHAFDERCDITLCNRADV
ncbi:hypothetical protein HK22_00850 [Gluconobacter sp. DsW_056]|nr:hypothetical protein HK22_00850 [Gluconobacter sp. DsW_056]